MSDLMKNIDPAAMGKIHPAGAMFLVQDIGTADGAGDTFEVGLVNLHTPSVRSRNTGKTFILPWEDIIRLACAHGVAFTDEEPTDA